MIAVEPVRPPTPDAVGAYTVELAIPAMPVTVPANGEFGESYSWALPPGTRVRRVRTFAAVDRLNVWEGHVLVLADDHYLAVRSPHKEATGNYEAWEAEDSDYVSGPAGALLNVHVLCRSTAAKVVNCAFGIVLELVPPAP